MILEDIEGFKVVYFLFTIREIVIALAWYVVYPKKELSLYPILFRQMFRIICFSMSKSDIKEFDVRRKQTNGADWLWQRDEVVCKHAVRSRLAL